MGGVFSNAPPPSYSKGDAPQEPVHVPEPPDEGTLSSEVMALREGYQDQDDAFRRYMATLLTLQQDVADLGLTLTGSHTKLQTENAELQARVTVLERTVSSLCPDPPPDEGMRPPEEALGQEAPGQEAPAPETPQDPEAAQTVLEKPESGSVSSSDEDWTAPQPPPRARDRDPDAQESD
jgi:hypothetical protein